VELGNPNEVWKKGRYISVSQPEGKPNSSVGTGRIKKRRLSPEREQEDITGQIGKYPHPKVADVIQVHHPKNDEKVTYQGKS